MNYHYTDTSRAFKITKIYTAFRNKYGSDYLFSGERHDFWELVIATNGQVGITAGSDVFVLQKGQAFLHEPLEFHRLWSEEKSEPGIIIFTFCAEGLPAYSTRLYTLPDPSIPDRILSQLRSAFQTEGIFLVGEKEDSRTESQIALKNLEIFLLKTLSCHAEIPETSSRLARNYAAIINTLENNLDKNLSVADIAQMCNMGQANLKQTFSRCAGMGVINYFNRLKINAAIPMLRNGVSVQETAALLGFSNQNYFSTVFKRITGKAPSYYKAGK